MKKYFLLIFFLFVAYSLTAAERKPYRVYLKPGTLLTKISDRSQVETTRGIYAHVLETSPTRRELFIVYDKAGKPVYETSAQAINEIEQDIQILPKVDANVIYPAPATHHSDNKIAYFNTQFNLHLDILQTSSLDSIYGQNLSNATGPRYEVRSLYESDLPINFGLGLNYQSVSWTNEAEGNITLSILSFGPQLERVLYTEKNLSVSFLAGGEFAPIYKSASSEFNEKYRAMLFDLGVEALWATRFGQWSLGSHFRHHELTLTSTNRVTLDPVPESMTVNSIGAMVGYKYEWNL